MIHSLSSPCFSTTYPLPAQRLIESIPTHSSIPMQLTSAYYMHSASPPHDMKIGSSTCRESLLFSKTARPLPVHPTQGNRRTKTHPPSTRPCSEYSHSLRFHGGASRPPPSELSTPCPIQTLLRRDEIISKTLGRDNITPNDDITLDPPSDPTHTTKGKRQYIPPPLNLVAPPPKSMHRARSSSLNIPPSPLDRPCTPLTPLSPIPGYREVPSEKEQRRRRMVKLARTLGEEIYPELANLPLKTNNNNSNIKEDWVILPERSSIATSTESLPWFHARTKKSSLRFSKPGTCTKGQSQPQNKSEGYDVSHHPRQLASSESLPDLTKAPRREAKWLPAKKSGRETTESQREQKTKDTRPKLLQRKNSAAQRKPVGIDDDIIQSPIIFCSPPSPVCDYPSFPSHPFRLVVEEDEEEEEEEEDDDDESESSSCYSQSEGDGEKLGEKADDLDCESKELECERGKLLEWKRGELLAVDPTRLAPPEINGGVVRKERRQGWSGEWNQPHIQDVIEKLRALK